MTTFRHSFAMLAAGAAAVLALASAAAAMLPNGIETFADQPFGTKTQWTTTLTAWTNAETGNAWEAYNVRTGWLYDGTNAALSIRATSASAKGFWRSQGTLTGGVQRLRVAFRQALTGKADCNVLVNGVVVGNYVSSGDTNVIDVLEWETIDPTTGLPFDGDFSLAISNRIGTSGAVIFDDVEWTPYQLYVTLDKSGTNVVYASDGEFEQPEFDVSATAHIPGGGVLETVEGTWTIEPEFAGGMNGVDDVHLTLMPAMADVGKEFTLTFTALEPAEEPEEGGEGGEGEGEGEGEGDGDGDGEGDGEGDGAGEGEGVEPVEGDGEGDAGEGDGEGGEGEDPPVEPPPAERFSHSASVKIFVEAATSPRYIDFEDMKTCEYSAVPKSIVLAGASWSVTDVHSSDKTDKMMGNRSLRMRHFTTNAAVFASPVFPGGLGTLSFRYANYHTNHAMTLKVQTRGEDDDEDDGEAWSDVADGAVSFMDRMDIGDVEFRVDIQEGGARAFRILSTEANGSIADIDNVRIRAFGETAPVLIWRGEPGAGLGKSWTGAFTYLHPTSDFSFSWSVTPELPRLTAETNLEDGTLTFTLDAREEDWGEYEIEATVLVEPDNVPDQRAKAALSVASFPEFELAPVATTVSNIVDIFVTNVVLYGAGTNWTVAWSAEPPFNGTNSVHNKSRYRVLNIEDDDGPHVVTAVLTDSKTKLSATRQVTIEVHGSSSGGGGDEPEPFQITAFTATNLCVAPTAEGWRYAAFAVEDLESGPDATNRVWEGIAAPGIAGGELWLEIEAPAADGRRFFGVEILPAD